MSEITKYNKGKRFTFEVKEHMPFISLKELYTGDEDVYPLRSMYISNHGKYGPAPVYITDRYFVNMPQHMVKVTEEIMSDREAVQLINGGTIGFTVYQYNSGGKECYSVNFVDM